jgi:hypothetical protein
MNDTKALAVQEPQTIARTERGILTRDALKEAAEQRALLSEYVKQQMRQGTDYGIIPGTEKPTLLKPGAEKLVDIFRCTPEFEIVSQTEDYERGLFAYTFRVKLLQRDAQAVLAEGYGSANSREGRYRWRNANPKCPQCGKETLFRSKKDPGFYCWSKKGGCGAQFGAHDATVKAAFDGAGKVENDDVATLANTILKMAKKRALVDGAIALARVSDLFTQDVEDLAPPAPVQESAAAHPIAAAQDAMPTLFDEHKAALMAARDNAALEAAAVKMANDHRAGKLTDAAKKMLAALHAQRKGDLRPRVA